MDQISGKEAPEVDSLNVLVDARDLLSRGALSTCAALLTRASLSQTSSDELILLLANVQFKLLDFSGTSSLLDRIRDPTPESEALRDQVRDILADQNQRGTALWNTLVWSNLETIQNVDRQSWRIMLGRLYHLAYIYTAGEPEVCGYLYGKFALQIRTFAKAQLLPSYSPSPGSVNQQSLNQFVTEAQQTFEHFSCRISAIFLYLDRYYLRLRRLPKLEEVCRETFLTVYFETAILPEIRRIWIHSLKQEQPLLPSSLQRVIHDYFEHLGDEGQLVKQRLFHKQRILCIWGSFPSELLKHILCFLSG